MSKSFWVTAVGTAVMAVFWIIGMTAYGEPMWPTAVSIAFAALMLFVAWRRQPR